MKILRDDGAGVAGDVKEAEFLLHIEIDLVRYLNEGGDQEDEEDMEEGKEDGGDEERAVDSGGF